MIPKLDTTLFSKWTLSVIQVTGSVVSGELSAVAYGGDMGVGAAEIDATPSDPGEVAQDLESFGAPGLVFRPRPPETISTAKGEQRVGTEAIGARYGDDVLPLAWRDLRFHKAFPNPKVGTVALVGYGGGFLAFDDTTSNVGDAKATVGMLYVPYEFTNGVPAKAMSIVLDPDLGALSIIHGEGQSVLLQEDKSITLQSSTGASMLRLDDAQIWLQSPLLVLNGGAVVVGNPTGAIVPLAPGPASPPCPRLFLNPAV